MGNDAAIGIANASGLLELNVMKPMIVHNLLESVELLADACDSVREKCVAGIEPNRAQIAKHVASSLMLVTALAPLVGYDAAAKIAKTAYEKDLTLKDAALQTGLVTAEQFDAAVRPQDMIAPKA
jgi:fumarate hydratase class II